jgi:hypothetical protein
VTPPGRPWNTVAEPNRYRSATGSSVAGSVRSGTTELFRPGPGSQAASRATSRAASRPGFGENLAPAPVNPRKFAKVPAYKPPNEVCRFSFSLSNAY